MMHGKKNFFENVPLILCPGGKILITIKKIYKLILQNKKRNLVLHVFFCSLIQVLYLPSSRTIGVVYIHSIEALH